MSPYKKHTKPKKFVTSFLDLLEPLDVVLGLVHVPMAHRVREGGEVVGQLFAVVDLQ